VAISTLETINFKSYFTTKTINSQTFSPSQFSGLLTDEADFYLFGEEDMALVSYVSGSYKAYFITLAGSLQSSLQFSSHLFHLNSAGQLALTF